MVMLVGEAGPWPSWLPGPPSCSGCPNGRQVQFPSWLVAGLEGVWACYRLPGGHSQVLGWLAVGPSRFWVFYWPTGEWALVPKHLAVPPGVTRSGASLLVGNAGSQAAWVWGW